MGIAKRVWFLESLSALEHASSVPRKQHGLTLPLFLAFALFSHSLRAQKNFAPRAPRPKDLRIFFPKRPDALPWPYRARRLTEGDPPRPSGRTPMTIGAAVNHGVPILRTGNFDRDGESTTYPRRAVGRLFVGLGATNGDRAVPPVMKNDETASAFC